MTEDMADAIENLAIVFGDGWTAGDTGKLFTCGEADSIARVLVLAGHTDAAEVWLSGHLQGDDAGDLHGEECMTDNGDLIEGSIRTYLEGMVA